MSVNALTYDHAAVEKKWQEAWVRTGLDTPDVPSAKQPFYNLMMFPYPSAEGLHVGNMYAFTGSDIYGRYMRMLGYDVFEPIGLDGFGIHSENYSLKIGRHPMEQAKRSQENFYRQLRTIGAMFDWTRTVETYDPDYYRWTQWIFIQMFKHGLAYRGNAQVNWCPSCKTVLADEQVLPTEGTEGKCERCGNIVGKRLLEQWFFRITAYAEKLLENIKTLNWSERVLVAQRNWIGKKEGINITYDVVNETGAKVGELVCFTTRPETNFGATFVVIAPEHPFVTKLIAGTGNTNGISTLSNGVIKNKETVKSIQTYISAAAKKSQAERIAEGTKKTGVATGLYCLNNLNGQSMPLFVSDFVLAHVGTGAVVGVPGHDRRDFDFAKTFGLTVKRVVVGPDKDTSEIESVDQVQEDAGIMVNSGFLDGLDIHAATVNMMDYLEEKKWGKRVNTYHLRDWIISRQRYWGPPIPMVFCKHCQTQGKSWFTTEEAKQTVGNLMRNVNVDIPGYAGWYPVPEDQLPVLLPHIVDYKPGDDGVAPLAKHKEFYEVHCPGCGQKARRETDVSDTFLDSSWYFLRYPSIRSVRSGQAPFDPSITKKWLPVSMYTGGAEHSVLHLLYSRFVTMALHDFGYLDFDEPFPNFFAHGLVIKDGAKMSKSKGNIINPDEYIKLYGTDALRLYLMFMGPFDQGGDFRDSAMEGMYRWIRRAWNMAVGSLHKTENREVAHHLAKLVKKVTEDTKKRRYNTAIAAMMEFTNTVSDHGGSLSRDQLGVIARLLAPYAPHMAEELWQMVQGRNDADFTPALSVHTASWPAVDESQTVEETVTIAVSVNGKTRGTVQIPNPKSHDQKEVEKAARANPAVAKHLAGKTVARVIFVAGRIINFVVA